MSHIKEYRLALCEIVLENINILYVITHKRKTFFCNK